MDPLDGIGRELRRDHLAALDVMRHAKNAFFWLALVAVALHVGSWVVVQYTDALEPLRLVMTPAPGPAGTAMPTEAERATAERWNLVLGTGLALGGFVGRASVLVLTGILLISLLVSLSARLGGAAHLAQACVWSLAALAMLVPWLRAPDEVATLSSAFYAVEDLNRAVLGGATEGALAFVKFLVCPILVAVFLLLAQYRFRSAHGQIVSVPGAKLPIHEV